MQQDDANAVKNYLVSLIEQIQLILEERNVYDAMFIEKELV